MKHKFFEHAVEFARDKFLTGKEVMPTFIVKNEAGETSFIVCPWRDEEEKQQTITYLKVFFVAQKVVEYAFMSEMWFKAFPTLEDRPSGPICDMPDKREGLFIVSCRMEDGKIEQMAKSYEVFRENGGIRLADMNYDSHMEGSFLEMLTPKEVSAEDRSQLKRLLEYLEDRLPFKLQKVGVH